MNETMGAIIARKRKELGLTQEQLAAVLGISYQAVSKWENELSSPDIAALPLLADTLGLTLDELFGREAPKTEAASVPAQEPEPTAEPFLPWADDDTLYAVLFMGHRLVGHESAGDRIFSKKQLTFCYEGPALNIRSDFDVSVNGSVAGDVNAGGDVNCGNVLGHVNAGSDVDCGDVEGNLSAGGDVDCGKVAGSVNAGGDIDCGTVGGSVSAMGDVDSGVVKGGSSDDEEFHSNLKGRKKGFSFELKL